MLQDVDESAQRIADVEPPHAPRFGHGTVLQGCAGSLHPPKCLRQIIHLDRKIRNGRIRAALAGNADLYLHFCRGSVGTKPAVVHEEIEAEDAAIEVVSCRDISGFEIGNDPLNLHSSALGEVFNMSTFAEIELAMATGTAAGNITHRGQLCFARR